jgi:hypothetical protein
MTTIQSGNAPTGAKQNGIPVRLVFTLTPLTVDLHSD